jgi:hypothetical protein
MLIMVRSSQDFACCATATERERWKCFRFRRIRLGRLERDLTGYANGLGLEPSFFDRKSAALRPRSPLPLVGAILDDGGRPRRLIRRRRCSSPPRRFGLITIGLVQMSIARLAH